MTDKEIIIDGVDVSQCVYRMKDEYNTCCCTSTKENEGEERITAYYGCKYNHNCHYKQLKRKEEECEKKSWEIGNLGYKIKNQRREINERLRQIEKLKRKEQALDIIEEYCMQCNLRWDFTAQIILHIINKIEED